jgi:glycosyltransferase involved in cell wall biosynthesis
MRTDKIRIRTFYPADPLGVVPGGVDTFIRGLIKWAPDDIQYELVGMTTDPDARPVGQWTQCAIGRRNFDFFPLVHVRDPGHRSRVPLSVRFTASLALRRSALAEGFEIFEFHRIEPALLFRSSVRPRCAFFHQDMAVLRDASSDILWRHAPATYQRLESSVVNKLSAVWCVRDSAVASMRSRYPTLVRDINFVPTWVDTEVFNPCTADIRKKLRSEISTAHGLDPEAAWIVSVGRLDAQKDPSLLVSAFAALVSESRHVNLLLVGDGTLRRKTEEQVRALGLTDRVCLLGLLSQQEISRVLCASDVFALSSAYEGMPMAVLEALGTGLPVAATDVGEIRRIVSPGVNGEISSDRTVDAFSACLGTVLQNRDKYAGAPAVDSIRRYGPAQVLQRVYARYRELGAF